MKKIQLVKLSCRGRWGSAAGQGLTEYAVVLSLVAIAAIASMGFFGGAIKGKIASLSGAIAGSKAKDVQDSEDNAKSAATKAVERSKKARGNTSITKEDIYDEDKDL